MLDSRVTLYVVAEMAILLLFVSIFLLVHVSNLKKLVASLEKKIGGLRQTLATARKEAADAVKQLAEKASFKPRDYLSYLDEEIERTRNHHLELNPDRDIVLDITPEAPIERQAASLRHAFLVAEKEARYAGEDDESSWDILQAKLQQIISFYAADELAATHESDETDSQSGDSDDQDELIAGYQKRIENLEKFKKLYFEMEKDWQKARAEAEDYYEQILKLGLQLGGGEHFESILNDYSKVYDGLGELLSEASDRENSGERSAGQDADLRVSDPSVGKMVIANQEEIQRLKNMAVDQHKVITQLKRQLMDASSLEEYETSVAELTKQLDRQQRFIKEAETCTQLLEDELDRALEENRKLKNQVNESSEGISAEEKQQIEKLISDMSSESHEMLKTIAALEDENEDLKKQLVSSSSRTEDDKNAALLKEKLTMLQQELLNLQTQHIELEERYLELKTKA